MKNYNKITKEIQAKKAECVELNKRIESNKACINKLQYQLLRDFELSLYDLKWDAEKIVLSFRADITSLDSRIKALCDERYIRNGSIRIVSDQLLLTIWADPSELIFTLKEYNIRICDFEMVQIRELLTSVLHMQDHDKRLKNYKYESQENNSMSSKPAVIESV